MQTLAGISAETSNYNPMHVWKGHVWKHVFYCQCDVLRQRTGKVRAEPTLLHLQGLDLFSCHLHVYGDFIDSSFWNFPISYWHLWTSYNMEHLNIGSYQLLKWSVQSNHFLGSGPHVSAPGHDQIRHTYVKWVREWTQAGFKPRFIWVIVMDSTEVGFWRRCNVLPHWSSVTWMTTTRELGGFVRFLRSCGEIHDGGRQIKKDSHWQRKVHNVNFFKNLPLSLVLTSIAPISKENVTIFSFAQRTPH